MSVSDVAQSNIVDAYAEKTIEQSLVVFDDMYLDLSLVRDYALGAINSLIMERSEEEASAGLLYITANIRAYQMRRFDNYEAIFPELCITNDQIKERLSDPQHADAVFALSPTTEYVGIIKYLIALNINNSQLVEKFDRRYIAEKHYVRDSHPVTMHVNTYPLELNNRHKALIIAFFADNYYVNVHLLCTPPEDLPPALIGKAEEFHVRNLDGFLRNNCVKHHLSVGGETATSLRSTNMFLNKRFFAPMIFEGHREANLEAELVQEHVRMIHSTLDALSKKFDWIPTAHIAIDLSVFADDIPDPTPEK